MTTQEIITNIRRKLLELGTGVLTDEEILDYANQTQIEIANEFLSQDRIKGANLSFTNGEADLPSDFLAFYYVEDDFHWVSREDFEKGAESKMLTINGNKILAKPATTSSVRLWYFKRPSDLSVANPSFVPELPELLHQGIVLGACAKALEKLQEFGLAGGYEGKFRAFLEVAKRNISRLEERGYKGRPLFDDIEIV